MKLKKQNDKNVNYPVFKSYLLAGLTMGIATFSSGCGPKEQTHTGGVIPVPVRKDYDGDGILDKDDRCPKTIGSKTYDGCPAPVKMGKMVAPKPHPKSITEPDKKKIKDSNEFEQE